MEQSNIEQIISQITTYYGSHNQPLINIFSIEYVIGILDRSKIESIDKIYRSKQDGFNLLQFIRFFLNVIEHQQVQTLYLTIALVDFFKQISKSSEYKEKLMFVDLTNYICNRILEKRDQENQIQSSFIPDYRTIKPNYKIKNYLINPPKIFANKDELIYKLSLNKIKIDKMKHESVITNCYFSRTLHKVFTLDVLSDSISVYNTSCCLLKKIKPNFSKLKKDIVVLSFAYSQRQERIGAVLKDFSLNFWDNSDNFEFQKSISAASFCQQYQTNIWFFQYFNSWVTSDKTGCLYIWDLQQERPQRTIKLASQTKVNDLCVIPCLNLVAVVQQRKVDPLNMNKKSMEQPVAPVIMVYDYFKGQPVTKIQLAVQNRVPHTIQYSEAYHVLLTAGYEKKISIFQINKQYLDSNQKGQLTGHQSLITSFTLLKKSPMVISADDKGKVKIWDLRNYKCVQTLDFRDKTNITKLLDMIELGKIGVLGSRINFVEFDQKIEIQKKMHQQQKAVPYWVQFDYSNLEIIMLTKKDLRVFDMKRGTLSNIYCEFHTQDTQITFFKYLQSLQKFIIGNQKGQVKLYSVRTGRLQSRLISHQGSITYAQYDQLNKIFITMGQDSTIQIQKQLKQKHDSNNEQYKSSEHVNSLLLRQMKNNFYGKQITFGAVSIYHGFLAVGSSQKNIYIWDYEFSKLLIEISLPDTQTQAQPTSLAFINGYSILLIGTSEGKLHSLKLIRKDQQMQVENICTFDFKCRQPITHIMADILLKGFVSSQQKLLSCKIHIGFQTGLVISVDFKKISQKVQQQISATNKQSFNAERQLRQNFTTQIQKNKYHKYTINVQEAMFKEKQFPKISYQAHKCSINAIQIIELDQRFVATIGNDERFKIWRGENLICDTNINLPLPYKWQMLISDEQKIRQKIMFALKIIQKIFLNYGNDISINQSKVLKVKKLFEQLNCSSNHLTEPTLYEHGCQKQDIVLFQNEFTREDMHYDSVKKFNFNQVAGPTLRQIEVKKKLDHIQQQWQTNKNKNEQDKVKLLSSIRQKAQKNEEKQNIIQFLQTRNFGAQKTKDNYQKHPYVTKIMKKLDNLNTPSLTKRQTPIQLMKSNSVNYFARDKNILSSNNLFKTKSILFDRSKVKNTDQQICHKRTFEKYYRQKMLNKQTRNGSSFRVSRLQTSNTKCRSNFRQILSQMNENMKKSKKSAFKGNESSFENSRHYLIATSQGKRRF